MSRVNDLSDLEIVTPEPVTGMEGFYYCPLDRRLGVNRDSEILNIKTGKILPPKVNKSNGGHYVFVSSPRSPTKAYLVHRIVAITFIGRPTRHLDKDYSRLEVNHIDGIRTNNSLDNLEWVTGNENVIHARDTGLRVDNFKVLVKCIVSGVITTSISVDQCSKDYDISKPTLHRHLKSNNTLRYHRDGYLFRYESDGPWPVNHPDEIKEYHLSNEIGNGTRSFGIITIHDLTNGNKFIGTVISRICELLSVSSTTLGRYLKKSDSFILGNFQFKVEKRF